MKLRLGLAALAAVFPAAAIATPANLGTFVPDQVIIGNDGIYLYGGMGSAYPNPEPCQGSTYIKIVGATAAEQERMYSMLLTSIASGKTVTIFVDGCVASVWGYTVPKGYHLVLNR